MFYKLNREIVRLMIKLAKQSIYENFGQKEVRKLEEKYIDLTSYSSDMNTIRDMIQSFSKWCQEYTG